VNGSKPPVSGAAPCSRAAETATAVKILTGERHMSATTDILGFAEACSLLIESEGTRVTNVIKL
jgi:hypothetical protein